MTSDVRLPFLNARFRVEIEGLPDTGAVEVVFPEGRIVGRHGKSSLVQYGPLTLRRGMSAASDWYRWWDSARGAARVPPRRVTIVLIGRGGEDVQRWAFSHVVPVAYAVSPLHALQSEVLIETLELAVGGFELAPERDAASTPVKAVRAAKPRPRRARR